MEEETMKAKMIEAQVNKEQKDAKRAEKKESKDEKDKEKEKSKPVKSVKDVIEQMATENKITDLQKEAIIACHSHIWRDSRGTIAQFVSPFSFMKELRCWVQKNELLL